MLENETQKHLHKDHLLSYTTQTAELKNDRNRDTKHGTRKVDVETEAAAKSSLPFLTYYSNEGVSTHGKVHGTLTKTKALHLHSDPR